MKQAFTKRFLCLALLLPFQVMIAQTATQPCVQVQDKSHFVYLSTEMRRAVECLSRMLPNHTWSPEFKEVCDRIAKDGIAAPFAEAEAVVVECLNLLDGNNCAELQEAQDALKRYAESLRKGDANLVLIDDNGMVTRASCCNTGCNTDCNTSCNSKCIKYKGTKAFCNLFAQDLQVPGSGYIANLTTNSFRVTGNAVISGDLTVDGTIFTDETLTFEDIVVDDLTVNGTFTANGVSNIGTNLTNDAINIGTAAAVGGRAVTIGNPVALSSVGIEAGTGGIAIATTGAAGADIALDSDNALTIDADTTLDLNVAAAGTINVGTDVLAQTINVGSTAATSFTANALTMNIGDAAVAQAINIGTGLADHDVVIGSATAGSTITLTTPATTGVSLRGLVGLFVGAGSPNTVLTAQQGSLYLNTTGTGVADRAFINTDGATAWTAITTVA